MAFIPKFNLNIFKTLQNLHFIKIFLAEKPLELSIEKVGKIVNKSPLQRYPKTVTNRRLEKSVAHHNIARSLNQMIPTTPFPSPINTEDVFSLVSAQDEARKLTFNCFESETPMKPIKILSEPKVNHCKRSEGSIHLITGLTKELSRSESSRCVTKAVQLKETQRSALSSIIFEEIDPFSEYVDRRFKLNPILSLIARPKTSVKRSEIRENKSNVASPQLPLMESYDFKERKHSFMNLQPPCDSDEDKKQSPMCKMDDDVKKPAPSALECPKDVLKKKKRLNPKIHIEIVR